MKIVRYTPDRSAEWDGFVKASRNGTFLFLRGYMDYHADRFRDHSLMYYSDKDKLLAVMAANEVHDEADGKQLYSHQGLTYGGLVLARETKAEHVLEMLTATKEYLKAEGFTRLIYKQIPVTYHRYASMEDEYALWLNGAETVNCKLGTAVSMTDEPAEYRKMVRATKKTDTNRLLRMGYTIEMNASLEDFWPVLTDNLRRSFGATPVHTFEEMQMLMERFPKNIVCCVIRNPEGEVEAGTLLYLMDTVVHTQYMSATEQGKQSNAMDCLMLSLILHYREAGQYRYFDFGTSMADDNIHVKPGLIAQKEGFGGRGVVYKTLSITV